MWVAGLDVPQSQDQKDSAKNPELMAGLANVLKEVPAIFMPGPTCSSALREASAALARLGGSEARSRFAQSWFLVVSVADAVVPGVTSGKVKH